MKNILIDIKNKLENVQMNDEYLLYSDICIDCTMMFLELKIPHLRQCTQTKLQIEQYLKNKENSYIFLNDILTTYNREVENIL